MRTGHSAGRGFPRHGFSVVGASRGAVLRGSSLQSAVRVLSGRGLLHELLSAERPFRNRAYPPHIVVFRKGVSPAIGVFRTRNLSSAVLLFPQ